jgi:hypothetical protein
MLRARASHGVGRQRDQIWRNFDVRDKKRLKRFLKNIFMADAFISPFNTQTMHIKSFYTQQQCHGFLKTLYPGGIRTRVFSFLRRMRCPLRHAAKIKTFVRKSSITQIAKPGKRLSQNVCAKRVVSTNGQKLVRLLAVRPKLS